MPPSTKCEACVLDLFCGREQVGIERRCANRGPDLAHRLAYRIVDSATRILHQVPSVHHLGRLGQSLDGSHGVSAVADDDGDLQLLREPGLCRRGLAIRQESDRPAPLETTA